MQALYFAVVGIFRAAGLSMRLALIARSYVGRALISDLAVKMFEVSFTHTMRRVVGSALDG